MFFFFISKTAKLLKSSKAIQKDETWKNNVRNFAHERKFLKFHKYVSFKIQLLLPDFKPWWTR